MDVTKIHKNCLGTISFNAKFVGMRKEQEFIVYPNPDKDNILVQSDNRIGYIKPNGAIEYAIAPNTWAFKKPSLDFIDNHEELRAAIRDTASPMAGTNGIMYCDNSTASEV